MKEIIIGNLTCKNVAGYEYPNKIICNKLSINIQIKSYNIGLRYYELDILFTQIKEKYTNSLFLYN